MSEPAPPVEHPASRRRLVVARALTVLGILLVVVSLLANFVKREALDNSRFRGTSRELVTDPTIRDEIAATLVDQLYANVDVSAALTAKLPPNLRGLAGPIAGASRDAADRAARSLLERPRAQDAFVNASSLAQRELVAVLDGDTEKLQTTNGKVVLDVRPLVLTLGQRFSFLPDLESRIPSNAAQVTILESNQLKAAQDVTKGLRFVADWIWILALAAWAAAVWLAEGRRRIEVRAMAIGLLVSGFLILIVQTVAGRYLVSSLVPTESVRPAAASAYRILTELLRGAGWTAIIIALVALGGVWLTGSSRRAGLCRCAMTPYLRQAGVAYSALAVAYLLLLWWRPTPQFGFLRNVVVYFAVAAVGMEALRRQAVREFPDAKAGDTWAAFRAALASHRPERAHGRSGTAGELEHLARLHEAGSLDDTEFAAAKSQLLGLAG